MEAAALRCTEGRMSGQEIELDSELMIGRGFGERGRLGGDPRLSRRHARVHRDDSGQILVEDLGSANGTWVNGERISTPHRISPGDVLRFGQTLFEVVSLQATEIPAPAPAAPPPAAPPPAAHATPPKSESRSPCLTVTTGPLAGREIPIGEEFLIGRAYPGDGGLGAGPKLSRRHARIARGADGTVFVDDTGSTNGTFVNGQRLRGPRALRDGDEIRIGGVTMRAAVTEPARAPVGAAASAVAPASSEFAPRGAAGARRRTRTIVAAFAGVLGLVVAASIAIVVLVAPSGPKTCALDRPCQPPATSPPLTSLTTYRSPLGFTAEYTNASWTVVKESGSALKLTRRTNVGDISLWIQGAPGSQARAVAQRRINNLSRSVIGLADDPAPEHRIFLPTVGFRSGVGGSFAGTVNSPQGAGAPITIAVMAASDSHVTVVISAQVPASDSGLHDAATQLVDQVIKTIRFPSDGGI